METSCFCVFMQWKYMETHVFMYFHAIIIHGNVCFHVFSLHENTKTWCFHVNIPFTFPPWHHNGKWSIVLVWLAVTEVIYVSMELPLELCIMPNALLSKAVLCTTEYTIMMVVMWLALQVWREAEAGQTAGSQEGGVCGVQLRNHDLPHVHCDGSCLLVRRL